LFLPHPWIKLLIVYQKCTIYTRLLAALFLPGIWPVFCLRLVHATYLEGQSLCMSYQEMFISNSLGRTEDDIVWTDVRNGTHDTDEDDTYDDLPYI